MKNYLAFLAVGLLACPMSVQSQTPASVATTNAAANPATPLAQTGLPPDLQQALQMPENPDQLKAVGTAVKAWMSKDPVSALTWTFAQQPRLFEAAKMTASAAANSPSTRAAGDWLIQQTPPRNIMVLHGFSIGWALKDPAMAEAWCTQLQTSRDVRYACVFSVADGLCRKKGADAAAWAATLPVGDDRNAAIDGTATIWCRGKLAETTAWIKQLPPDDMKWAAMTIGRNWGLAKDKAGLTLEQWADQLPLSAEDKQSVVKGPYFDSFHISAYQTAIAPPSKT